MEGKVRISILWVVHLQSLRARKLSHPIHQQQRPNNPSQHLLRMAGLPDPPPQETSGKPRRIVHSKREEHSPDEVDSQHVHLRLGAEHGNAYGSHASKIKPLANLLAVDAVGGQHNVRPAAIRRVHLLHNLHHVLHATENTAVHVIR